MVKPSHPYMLSQPDFTNLVSAEPNCGPSEPRRRKIGSQLLAAIQCVRSWRDAGFKPPTDRSISELTDDKMVKIYDICSWDTDAS
jgi:hypothetical protein